MIKNIIDTLSKKRDDLYNCGMSKRCHMNLYCLVPRQDYIKLIRHLFNDEGAMEILDNSEQPALQMFGFWLVESSVDELIFTGTI